MIPIVSRTLSSLQKQTFHSEDRYLTPVIPSPMRRGDSDEIAEERSTFIPMTQRKCNYNNGAVSCRSFMVLNKIT